MKEYIFFNKSETVASSIIKDITTYGFLILCIYLSQDSKWWTFVTATTFLLMVCAKFKNIFDERYKTFKSKADLLAYVESLTDD